MWAGFAWHVTRICIAEQREQSLYSRIVKVPFYKGSSWLRQMSGGDSETLVSGPRVPVCHLPLSVAALHSGLLPLRPCFEGRQIFQRWLFCVFLVRSLPYWYSQSSPLFSFYGNPALVFVTSLSCLCVFFHSCACKISFLIHNASQVTSSGSCK